MHEDPGRHLHLASAWHVTRIRLQQLQAEFVLS